MQLPQDSIFNDYTVLFNVKSNIKYKTYSPTYTNEKEFN